MSETNSRRVVLMMPPGQVKDLDQIAQAEDRSRSYVIRLAVEEYLKRRKEWEL